MAILSEDQATQIVPSKYEKVPKDKVNVKLVKLDLKNCKIY